MQLMCIVFQVRRLNDIDVNLSMVKYVEIKFVFRCFSPFNRPVQQVA